MSEPQTLMRLIYLSQRAEGITDEQIMQMLANAVAKNKSLKVTGCLWFGGSRFLQVIEGERRIIHGLYEKIAANPMHHHCQIVHYALADDRLFENWSMGYIRENEDGFVAETLIHYFQHHEHPIAAETPDQLARVMTALRHSLDVKQAS